MDAQEQAEAGPSSPKPVFKKKKSKSRAVGLSSVGSPTHEVGTSDKEAGPAEGDDDEDNQDQDGLSVADLIALRNLNRKPTGIELDKLNKGLKKKKKNKKKDTGHPASQEDLWKEQMAKGGLVKPGEISGSASSRGPMPSRGANDSDSDDDDEDDAAAAAAAASRAKRRVRQDNFQGETNVIDVDKHMMAYIESEMLKRRAATSQSSEQATNSNANVSQSDIACVLSNPEDELYKVAEKYTRLQAEARNAATANQVLPKKSRPDGDDDDDEGQGNVGLSSAMLSGIPEVELGMDSRLKNIEDTEKAKRALYQSRQHHRQKRGDAEADEMLAGARFYNPRKQIQSDAQVLAEARQKAQQEQDAKDGVHTQSQSISRPQQQQQHSAKREMATDDQVMQRFKKRQMNNMKR